MMCWLTSRIGAVLRCWYPRAGRLRRGGKLLVEVEDIANRTPPERVDRLRIVSVHREFLAVGAALPENLRLDRVGVLILIDQDPVEPLADQGAGHRVGQQPVPGKGEDRRKVKDVLRPLALGKGRRTTCSGRRGAG